MELSPEVGLESRQLGRSLRAGVRELGRRRLLTKEPPCEVAADHLACGGDQRVTEPRAEDQGISGFSVRQRIESLLDVLRQGIERDRFHLGVTSSMSREDSK